MMKFNVANMKCQGCVSAVKSAIDAIPGVTTCSVDLETAIVEVDGAFDASQIEQAITTAGYPATLKLG